MRKEIGITAKRDGTQKPIYESASMVASRVFLRIMMLLIVAAVPFLWLMSGPKPEEPRFTLDGPTTIGTSTNHEITCSDGGVTWPARWEKDGFSCDSADKPADSLPNGYFLQYNEVSKKSLFHLVCGELRRLAIRDPVWQLRAALLGCQD